MASQLSNSYFGILLMSKSLVTSEVLNLEVLSNMFFIYLLMFCIIANSYFDILPMSKLLVTSKYSIWRCFIKYVYVV